MSGMQIIAEVRRKYGLDVETFQRGRSRDAVRARQEAAWRMRAGL